MATKKSRGRKGPRRKQNRYLVHGKWIKVKYFDGYRLRHAQPDEVDIMMWRGDGSAFSSVLKRNTLYIDKPHRSETEFFVKIFEIETMRKWTRRGDNRRLPPYLEKREYLKKQLCAPFPASEADYVVRKEWNAEHRMNIWYVRGDIVRKSFDPHFTHGGHDLVYPSYIKEPRTSWIDIHQDEREIPFTILHEGGERKKMERGWSYAKAHAYAIQCELAVRVEEYFLQPVKESPDPLAVVPIDQSETGCGPTGCKMLLDYDGILKPDGTPYSEEELIALCECDPYFGTDHVPLVRGMSAIASERVVHGEGGTIADLRRIVLTERRPVLVGWWSGPHRTPEEVRAEHDLDEGHYAIVHHVSRTRVWLADSAAPDPDDAEDTKPGIVKMPIREFLERWYDMDGNPSDTDPGYRLVRGWYLYLKRAQAPKP